MSVAKMKEVRSRLKGGQLEIVTRDKENFIYRGEIESVEVKAAKVTVNFVWLAQLRKNGQWTEVDCKPW